MGTEGGAGLFMMGSRRRRFEPSDSFAILFFHHEPSCLEPTLTQLSCCHGIGMMMPAAAPSSLSLVGPRERLALWDPFGAVQCELGITSRHVCTLLQQPPGLSLSLTHPRVPLWPTTCCCFCFWTLHRIKATAAARQQPAGTRAEGRKGPARAPIVLVSIVSIPRRL